MPEKGSEYFGSAVCETNTLSIYPSVHKQLIRSIPNPFRGTSCTRGGKNHPHTQKFPFIKKLCFLSGLVIRPFKGVFFCVSALREHVKKSAVLELFYASFFFTCINNTYVFETRKARN